MLIYIAHHWRWNVWKYFPPILNYLIKIIIILSWKWYSFTMNPCQPWLDLVIVILVFDFLEPGKKYISICVVQFFNSWKCYNKFSMSAFNRNSCEATKCYLLLDNISPLINFLSTWRWIVLNFGCSTRSRSSAGASFSFYCNCCFLAFTSLFSFSTLCF